MALVDAIVFTKNQMMHSLLFLPCVRLGSNNTCTNLQKAILNWVLVDKAGKRTMFGREVKVKAKHSQPRRL